MQIGMVGLGRMGSNMVRRLMRDGHQVVVFDLNRETVEQLSNEGAKGSGSLDAGLAAVAAFDEPALFVLLDAHRHLEDPLATRRLRDLLPALSERRQAVILVAPVIDLPVELVREAGRVELPLPNLDRIGHSSPPRNPHLIITHAWDNAQPPMCIWNGRGAVGKTGIIVDG